MQAGVALLARQAHQLHADADAQHGLRERGDHGVETPFAEFRHRGRSLPDSRQDHPVGAAQQRGVGREDEFGPGAVQGVGNRPQVARIVIDYRYHRTPLLLGMSYPKPCRPTAMRRARAKALKMASALWWSLSPRAEIVEVAPCGARERVEEVAEHLRRNVADPLAAEFGVPFEVDAASEVEEHQRPAVVHRQGEAVAGDSGLRAQRAVDGLAQGDGHILHRVVFVDVEVAPGIHGQRHAAVVGDLREHVVEEAQARGDLAVEVAAAVEVEADGDLRLAGLGAGPPPGVRRGG